MPVYSGLKPRLAQINMFMLVHGNVWTVLPSKRICTEVHGGVWSRFITENLCAMMYGFPKLI